MRNYKDIPASVVIFDTREFTNNFIRFKKSNDDSFVKLIEQLWQIGTDVASIISTDYHINSTGDGFVLIFFDANHEKSSYLCGLILYQKISLVCDIFSKEKECHISFGIGIESGEVQEIINHGDNGNISKTYLGNVINKAARIEAETKSHSRAKVIIGDSLNRKLVHEMFNEDYLALMNEVKDNFLDRDIVIRNINKMNDINQQMLLSYIFEHNLKGVDIPTPLFRVSPTLSNPKNDVFHKYIKNISSSNDIYNKLKSYLED